MFRSDKVKYVSQWAAKSNEWLNGAKPKYIVDRYLIIRPMIDKQRDTQTHIGNIYAYTDGFKNLEEIDREQ